MQRVLRGSTNLAYLHISKLAGLEDSTNQASKALRTLIIDFTGVSQPLHQEIISNCLTQVYPNTYNHSKQRLQMNFLSHNVYDYKWRLKVWINETRRSLRLNEGCIINCKLNDNSWISLYLNLIEPFYSWS